MAIDLKRAAIACAVWAAAAAHGQAGQPYRLQSAVMLKGARPAWDYLAFDPARGYLFIDRRADGVTVYDTRHARIVTRIARSEGANASALIPEFNRGYTTNGDGSTTIFTLSTLSTIGRVKLGQSADAAAYDSSTKQLAFMMGDEHRITFVDAAHGRVTGALATQSGELEAAAADGAGDLFIAERDRNAILRVDMRHRATIGEWPIAGCEQPTGLALDRAGHRLFAGCRGVSPVLAVVNTETGATVASLPIGRGNDGVIFDPEARRIFTSNGVDANLVIFDQTDPDHYGLDQVVTTRPIARTLAFDPKTKRLFTVTAEGWIDPAKPVNHEAGPFYPNGYFADTFTLLTYAPR